MQMAIFGTGADAVTPATAPGVLMLLGGAPIGERFIEWNCVSSSKERIALEGCPYSKLRIVENA